MRDEGLKQLLFLVIMVLSVIVEQVVEAQAMGGGHIAVNGYVGL